MSASTKPPRTPSISLAGREPTDREMANPPGIALEAIEHVLDRIAEDVDVAYQLGAGTTSLHLLLVAEAALTGKSVVVGEDWLRDRWASKAHGKPAKEALRVAVDLLESVLEFTKGGDELCGGGCFGDEHHEACARARIVTFLASRR